MVKIGNLFELAEKQLIMEKQTGIIPCYTELDVIEYAVLIRKWLDTNSKLIRKIIKLTPTELKIRHRESQKRYEMRIR
jgi:hypothetical protein